jgi:hypothetical protein
MNLVGSEFMMRIVRDVFTSAFQSGGFTIATTRRRLQSRFRSRRVTGGLSRARSLQADRAAGLDAVT